MPEGHTLHHHMRKQHALFAGHTLRCSSPQGRFTEGAQQINGATLVKAEAKGKHAFWEFDNGAFLHVHLGLYGSYRYHDVPLPSPKGAVRLRVASEAHGLDLNGPTKCRLLNKHGVHDQKKRLGEDPLHADADGTKVIDKLSRTKRPIGAVLLDQSVIAGIGNVYRAELLFVSNLNPHTPCSKVPRKELQTLWANTKKLMAVGADHNAIRVVGEAVKGPVGSENIDPAEYEVASRYGLMPDRLWVYKRRVCKLCGSAIEVSDLANRTLYRCPRCQK